MKINDETLIAIFSAMLWNVKVEGELEGHIYFDSKNNDVVMNTDGYGYFISQVVNSREFKAYPNDERFTRISYLKVKDFITDSETIISGKEPFSIIIKEFDKQFWPISTSPYFTSKVQKFLFGIAETTDRNFYVDEFEEVYTSIQKYIAMNWIKSNVIWVQSLL